ncbi:hypothetical protein Taro_042074 [Colocasia esculenta]|uniref:Uncharacterized protein n=1 Tax=Colocasia esculenta TaxID=4460 RepID=A0A843WHH0_COLES|nr:hypothetical protein [Colocasia esculenta]
MCNLSPSGGDRLSATFPSALRSPSSVRGRGWLVSKLVRDPHRILLLGCDALLVAFLFLCHLATGRWPLLGSGLLMLNATVRHVAFRSEGGTLVVATCWRQVGRRLLAQKATHLWSRSGCLIYVLPGGVPGSRDVPCVPALADGPSGVFWKGCRVVTVTWDPQSRASVRGISPSGGRAQVTDLEQKGKTSFSLPRSALVPEPRMEVRRGAVVRPDCGGCGCLVHAGCSLAVSSSVGLVSLASVWFPNLVACPRCRVVLLVGPRPCGGVLRVCFRIVLLWFDPGCSSWHYSSCFRIVVLLPLVGVPAALAGKGLVIPTKPCSRGSPPYSLQVASFLVGSECVAAAAGGTCCERGCCFAHAAVGFVLGLRLWTLVRCSRSFSLLVLVEVRLPQNCVVLISGYCGVAFWVELVIVVLPSRLRCIAWLPYVLVRFSRTVGCCPGENGALVVLVEVLPEPVVLLPLSDVFSLLAICLGCILVMVSRTALGALGGGVVPWTVCLAMVLANLSSCSFFRFLSCAGGTSYVPRIERLVSFLAPYGLCQLVVWVVVLAGQFGAMSRTVATLVAKVPPPCVVLSVPCVPCEAAPVLLVWLACASIVPECVSACASAVLGGTSAGSPRVLLVWVSGGESLSVGLGLFQAIGAVGYCTLSVFSFSLIRALCLEGLRPVWPVLPFLACGFLRVAFGSFGACGGTLYSCSSGLFSCRLEPWCIVLHFGWLLVALSVVRQALVVCLWSRCFSFLWLRSHCVSLSDHEDDLVLWLVGPWYGPNAQFGLLSGVATDKERDGSIRRVLNLKATPCVSLSGCGRILVASEGGTLDVATCWRQVGRHLLAQKVTHLWSCSGCLVSVLPGGIPGSRAVPCVPTLADGPSGVFWKGCRACLCLLSLSWLRSSGVVSVVVATPVLFRCRVLTPDCYFGNPFLGAIHGGTVGCGSLTSWCAEGLLSHCVALAQPWLWVVALL